jgi:hypothetical protein
VWYLRLQRRLDLIETLADAAEAIPGGFQLNEELVEWCAVASQSRQSLVHVCLPMQQPIVAVASSASSASSISRRRAYSLLAALSAV